MNVKVATALLLSPLMIHAQANTPAQPQAATAPVLVSSLVMPAGLMPSSASAANVPAADSGKTRVSTGVVEPKLVRTVPIQETTVSSSRAAARNREAVVFMVVDATGKPSELKIVQSAGADMDRDILEAVSHYRYQPGTVSGMAVATPVNLHVLIHEAAE